MTTVKEASQRIVKRFSDKKIDLDLKEINAKVGKLVNEFGLSLQEAERTILSAEARNQGIQLYSGQHHGDMVQDIGTLEPDAWVTVEGQVISVAKPDTKSIIAAGVIADRTGAIKFTAWARKKEGSTMLPEMHKGKFYRISKARSALYNGAVVLNLQSNAEVQEIEDEGNLKSDITPIGDVKLGIHTVRGKVIRLFQNTSDKIHQSGVIGDETGTIKFTAWKSDNHKVKLEEGKCYLFKFTGCSEYKGTSQLVITPDIEEIDEDIKVKTSQVTVTGNLVQIRPGSGLIKRCPVKGCTRALSRQNFCAEHEIQDTFTYDMRIKGVIDDGIKARSIIIPCSVTEKMTGMSLDEAIQMAETRPLGYDEVMNKIVSKVFGRYYALIGSEYPDRIYVTDAIPVEMDPAVLEELKAQVV